MNSILGENGVLYRFVNKLVDLLVLNIVYILTCLPIITIGAANSALYYVTMKMCKNEEGYIVKQYLNAFKDNFKKATFGWLFFLLVFIFLGLDFLLIGNATSEIGRFMLIVILAVFLLVMMPFSYMGPQIAVFENTPNNYMKNAVIISMTRIGYTIPIVIMNLLPIILFWVGGTWFKIGSRAMIMVGWSGIAYINSFLFNKVFERYK